MTGATGPGVTESRKNARWTNHEIRRLKEMHADGHRPPKLEVVAALPRHPFWSVMNMASSLGLRCGRRYPLETDVARWLRIAHVHFARRESGLLS